MRRIKAAGVGMRIFYRAYHAETAQLYFGQAFQKYVRMRVTPYASNAYFRSSVPLKCGIGSLIYVERTYLPKEGTS